MVLLMKIKLGYKANFTAFTFRKFYIIKENIYYCKTYYI